MEIPRRNVLQVFLVQLNYWNSRMCTNSHPPQNLILFQRNSNSKQPNVVFGHFQFLYWLAVDFFLKLKVWKLGRLCSKCYRFSTSCLSSFNLITSWFFSLTRASSMPLVWKGCDHAEEEKQESRWQDLQGLCLTTPPPAMAPYSAEIDISRHSVWRQQRAGKSPLPLRSCTPPTSFQASPSNVRHSNLGRVQESRKALQLAIFAWTSVATIGCWWASGWSERCWGKMVHNWSILNTLSLAKPSGKETIRVKSSSLMGTFTTRSSKVPAWQCKRSRSRGISVRGWSKGPEDFTTSTFSSCRLSRIYWRHLHM